MDDPLLRRAGLDYHEYVDVQRHASWAALVATTGADAGALVRVHDRRRAAPFADARFAAGRLAGLRRRDRRPAGRRCARASTRRSTLRLPMRAGQRSLNLSNAVAVAVFEAWRQNGYAGSV